MSTRALLAPYWYRVAALRPRLRSHVRLHRHEYRGEVWHVFEDRASGRHHRFNVQAWGVIGLFDGQRSLAEIWALLSRHVTDATPTQADIVKLLGQLHAADLLLADVTPDTAELFERRGKHEHKKWVGRLANPISMRFPLLDPDRLLERLARLLRPAGGRVMLLAWLAVVLPAVLMLPSHWRELTHNFSDQWLASGHLLMLAILFPLVKIAHELGHGLVCKWHGGEVHEAGLMLLAFYPVPYVDVSNSSAFAGKWQRALVGAACMGAELFIAALAFYAWVALEPGIARGIAHGVAVLASVTTLFFNANPLLRYDGYYILSDLIEIPNLGPRARQYCLERTEQRVFGVAPEDAMAVTPGERRWFLAYQPLSAVYRLMVSLGIALFIAQQFFFIGVALAAVSLGQGVVWPVVKGVHALLTAPRFAARATRVHRVLVVGVIVLGLGLFVLPLPYHTHADGVLWLPERAIVRAATAGFVQQVVVQPGQALAEGQAVVQTVEPALDARVQAQAAKVEETEAQVDAAWTVSQSHAQQLLKDLERERAALARLQDEADQLTLRAGAAGVLLMDKAADLPGRWLRKGEVVGYLRTADRPLVRVVVPQSDVDTVRLSTEAVEVRLPQRMNEVWPARLLRGVPAASRQLPSAVLGGHGGGQLVTDPQDEQGLRTLESVFEFELQLSYEVPHEFLGSRVHVRFEHPAEPIGLRAWRALRRAFLSTLHV
ncbi:MAG: M50 family metallopeptidase [Burkholderiales bacterium]|nr:M50 family metallopeptidase [Burkholderiales bacterium]